MKWVCAVLLVVGAAGFGVLLLRAGWSDLKRAWASRRWPTVEGLVEKVSEETHRMRGEGRASQGIQYQVKYCYSVADDLYHGRWESLISSSHRLGGCPFKAESVVSVYYDPEKPGISRLYRGVKAKGLFLPLGGAVFILAAIGAAPIFGALP